MITQTTCWISVENPFTQETTYKLAMNVDVIVNKQTSKIYILREGNLIDSFPLSFVKDPEDYVNHIAKFAQSLVNIESHVTDR